MQKAKKNGQTSMHLWKWACLVTAFAVVTACGGSGETGSTASGTTGNEEKKEVAVVPEKLPEPITLNVLDANGGLTQDSYMNNHGQYIIKKYPHISFNVLEGGAAKVPEYATMKVPVDIISSNANGYGGTAKQFGYAGADVMPFVTKHKYDLSKIDPSLLDVLRKMNDGKLPGLPTGINYQVMFYSKNAFDKFGEPYPTDGMTWDQVYEKARKMTRQEGGIQYAGFGFWDHSRLFPINQFGEELIDPITGKAVFNNVSSKIPRLFEQLLKFAQIPGNEFAIIDTANAPNAANKEGRIAMWLGLRSSPTGVVGDWDVVTYPSFSDLPGVGAAAEPSYQTVSSTSKHAEQAFLAITALLEPEVQKVKAQNGAYPIVPYAGWEADYYTTNKLYDGKNKKGLIVKKFPPAITLGPETSQANVELYTSFREVAKNLKDMNTALREAEERTNKKITDMRAAPK